jgi:CRP/FNR family transcriptional regulator, cyclic AMP receptor protein
MPALQTHFFDTRTAKVLVSSKCNKCLRRTLMSVAANIDFVDFAASIGTIADYVPGDVIFRTGDAASFMYVVLQGAVEIVVKGEILETVGPGKALGVLSLVDGKNRSADARASGATRLSLIDQKKFRYMVEEMPHFCWYVMDELAHRLRATNAAL